MIVPQSKRRSASRRDTHRHRKKSSRSRSGSGDGGASGTRREHSKAASPIAAAVGGKESEEDDSYLFMGATAVRDRLDLF